jgi:hypothetical protein
VVDEQDRTERPWHGDICHHEAADAAAGIDSLSHVDVRFEHHLEWPAPKPIEL